MINDYIFIYINLLIYFYSENNNILQLFFNKKIKLIKNFINKISFYIQNT